MRQLGLGVCLMCVLSGCKNGPFATNDPFYGRQTLPPPALDGPPAAVADPYYQNTPPAGARLPSETVRSAARPASPTSNDWPIQNGNTTPPPSIPGEFGPARPIVIPQGSTNKTDAAGKLAQAVEWMPEDVQAMEEAGQLPIGPLPPRRTDAFQLASYPQELDSVSAQAMPSETADPRSVGRVTLPEPHRLADTQAEPIVDILQLPPVRTPRPATTSITLRRTTAQHSTSNDSSTQPVSAPVKPTPTVQAEPTTPVAAAVQPTGKPYEHDPGYRWLSGRLEYSQSSQQWKLRYIPIDGQTDKFGGSVVLQDAGQLAQMQPGQFVWVQGQVVRDEKPGVGFAPRYEVTVLRPLDR